MKNISYLILLCSLLILQFIANPLYANFDVNQAVREVGIVTPTCEPGTNDTDCLSAQEGNSNKSKNGPSRFEFVTSVTDQRIPVSVITESMAQELFRLVAQNRDIPFRYPEDGCYARAHAMSRIFEDRGIISVKAFIEGNLRVTTPNTPSGIVEWWYHVAPVIKVRQGNQVVDMVFDPSIFDRPVLLSTWTRIQTSHEGGRTDRLYFTKRFNYTPVDTDQDRTEYSSADIEDMRQTMVTNMAIQRHRERQRTDDHAGDAK